MKEEFLTVILEKEDIWNMIRGTTPSYKMMSKLQKLKLGHFTGGFSERWNWEIFIPENMSISELCDLYTEIKCTKD